ncbi:hypothetical protein L1049_004891 [Liquidambar formosana]|uniref:SPX domain-containing protein n=1 Tax=Liquidambar formosana TaxID=63359 RepID=A0AAP0WYL9_LIQFO
MKWGKRLRDEVEHNLPEWRGEFLSYKGLKKQLKLIHPRAKECKRCEKRMRFSLRYCLNGRPNDANTRGDIGFIRLLEGELEKVNSFFIEKEETYIIILKEFQNRVANLDNAGERLQVQRDILNFHGEMVLLLHYCVLNITGLMKIVKKHNKRTGTSIRSSFMPRVLQQPFFATDLLYRLMRECEAMLNRLFLLVDP